MDSIFSTGSPENVPAIESTWLMRFADCAESSQPDVHRVSRFHLNSSREISARSGASRVCGSRSWWAPATAPAASRALYGPTGSNTFWFTHAQGRVVLVGARARTRNGTGYSRRPLTTPPGRVWDTTGRTDLIQLMTVLSRVAWVIGADTGPLHLGTALGARAVGFYFARARVHETGPYGDGHRIFQYRGQQLPDSWPVKESVDVILNNTCAHSEHWDLWRSRLDQWGASFTPQKHEDDRSFQREEMWRQLSPSLFATASTWTHLIST